MDIAVVRLTESGVLIELRRGLLEYAMEKLPGVEASEEAKGSEAIDLIVLLCTKEGRTGDAIGVPSRGDGSGDRGDVLDGVPPPGRVEEHIARVQHSSVDRAVLEEREGLLVVIDGPKAANHTSSAPKHDQRIGEVGVIGIHEPPLLLAVDLVEHVENSGVVEGRSSALSAHKELFIADLLVEIWLESLVLEQLADVRIFVEELLRVVEVDLIVLHLLELAWVAIKLTASQEDILFAILLQDGLPAQVLQQLSVTHEVSQDDWVRLLHEEVIEFLRSAILPVIFWNGNLSFRSVEARGFELRSESVAEPGVDHVDDGHETSLTEDDIEDGEPITGQTSDGPDPGKAPNGDPVITTYGGEIRIHPEN
jgi:hypothetical protein